jgi:uncharacterized membrane protein YhhN
MSPAFPEIAWILTLTGAVLVAALLVAVKKKSQAGRLWTKSVASLLFIAVAMVCPHPDPVYAGWVIAGLVCGFFGDLFLALPQRGMFLAGMAAFFMGHLSYVVAFAPRADLSGVVGLATVGIAVIGVGILVWLLPRLGRLKAPVAAYILIISTMLSAAVAVAVNPMNPAAGRGWVFAGALLFYLSDLFVARNRFVREQFINRLIGLPLYYAGQFILAFSVAALGKPF